MVLKKPLGTLLYTNCGVWEHRQGHIQHCQEPWEKTYVTKTLSLQTMGPQLIKPKIVLVPIA